jgi:hypothetical protein
VAAPLTATTTTISSGGVDVPVGDDGMTVAYDVTVVSIVESSPSASALSVSLAADAAEYRKAAHYENNCASQGMQFIPLAHETPDGRSTQVGKVLSLADGKGLLRATCRSSLFGELGIATQRSIARDIIERSCRLPEHVSAQLNT